MRTCGLWQLKLRTCGCGLFLILVRNSASFIQILKFILSIFVNKLCFYPVKHKKSINFFEFKFGKNIKFFKFRMTKILSLSFDLIAFFLLTCSFIEFGATTDFFSSLSSIWQPLFKECLCCFLPWVHKVSHCCIIFCSGNQCHCLGVAQGRRTPLMTACAPPFQFTQNAFLEHHVTTRQE